MIQFSPVIYTPNLFLTTSEMLLGTRLVLVNSLKRISSQRLFALKKIYTFSSNVTDSAYLDVGTGYSIVTYVLLERSEHRPNTVCRNFINFPYM